jgi:Ca2+-binding EF-hand superfamily protein
MDLKIFSRVLEQLGFYDVSNTHELFSQFDSDNDGIINYKEFEFTLKHHKSIGIDLD